MANVLDQAQNVQGVVSAARFRDRMARKEANATDEGQRRMYREAIFDVEERFPELGDIGIGGSEAFARERGHGTGARSPVHEGRRRSRSSSAPARTAAKKTSPSPPAGKGKAKTIPGLHPEARRTGRSSGQPTPRLDRAIAQTGIPAALSSSGSTTMAALGAIVGLSLLFLVLSSAERPGSGAAALPSAIGSVTHFLHRFLSLEDVFPNSAREAAESPGPLKPLLRAHGVPAGAALPSLTPHNVQHVPGISNRLGWLKTHHR